LSAGFTYNKRNNQKGNKSVTSVTETDISLASPPPNYQLFPTTPPALMLPSDAVDDDVMLVGME
jgi:hypothetical protein